MIWKPMWMIVCFETEEDWPNHSILSDHRRPRKCYMIREDAEKDLMELKAKYPHKEFYILETTHCAEMRDGVVFLEKIGEAV